MERKLTKLEHCHVELLVTVDEATWKAAQEKALKKLVKEVTIKGFRKGEAPLEMARKHVNPMDQMNEAINGLLPNLYEESIKAENVMPYAQPKVDITKVSDTELEVKFTITTAPEVELGKYTGLKVGKGEVSVNEEELANAIADLQGKNATLVVKEGEAKLGDTAVIDFEGFLDGKPFDGGKAENHELVLGSNSFIPGFEAAIVGHKAGEEFDIKVKFPENYVEELKGKDATFKIKLHEVKEKVLPELNDESVKEFEITGVETVEQLKEHLKVDLLKRKENEARNEFFGKLLEEIAKNSKVDIPDEIIESQTHHTIDDMVARMQQSGLQLKDYLQIIGQTEQQFHDQVKANATKEAQTFFIMDAILKAEKFEVTDKELENEYESLAKQYNMKVEDVKKALAPQLEDYKHNLAMKKVEDFLYEKND